MPGYAIERLPAWLDGASGSRAGVGYLAVQFVLQTAMSLSIGFLFCHPFAPTSAGQYFMLGLVAMITLTMGLYTLCGTANDLWDGIVTSLCYFLETVSLCFILASSLLMHALPGFTNHLTRHPLLAGCFSLLHQAAGFCLLGAADRRQAMAVC